MSGNVKFGGGVETSPLTLDNRLEKANYIIECLLELPFIKEGFSIEQFAGSSRFYCDVFEYSDSFLREHGKTTFGDIDVLVPDSVSGSDLINAVHQWHWIDYSGGAKWHGDTLSAPLQVFDQYIQVDFMRKPFDKSGPIPFSVMSNNWSEKDLKLGLKGVFHKQLLCALTASSARPELVEVPRRGGKKEIMPVEVRDLAFSVSKGLRYRYLPIIPCSNQDYGNLGLFKELKSEGASYITDLPTIFEWLFGLPPELPSDIENLHDFVGVIHLINTCQNYLNRKKIALDFYRRVDELPNISLEQKTLAKKVFMENLR